MVFASDSLRPGPTPQMKAPPPGDDERNILPIRALDPRTPTKVLEKSQAGAGAFTHSELGGIPWPRSENLGSEMRWRGVGDYQGEEREARPLLKGEQLPCSGWVNAPPPVPRTMLKRKELKVGKNLSLP